MPAQIDLSVVIVTHNVAHLIGNCLDSVRRECNGISSEVFVVDCASSDDTPAAVRRAFPEARLHASPYNLGFSAGNNLALPECRGRYVVLLNPDTVVHPGGLRELMAHLELHPEAGAAGPTLRLGSGEIQSQCAQNLPTVTNMFTWLFLLDKIEWALRFRKRAVAGYDRPHSTLLDQFQLLSWGRDKSCEVEMICGACLMVRREVIETIGLLDETSPMFLDDIDYCRRIRDAGWRIHYRAGPTVTHLWKQSSAPLARQGDFYALACHSIYLYLRKHEGRMAAAAFVWTARIASLIRMAAGAAALLFSPSSRRDGLERSVAMASGLARWAWPPVRKAPRFGFFNEQRQATGPVQSLFGSN